MWFKKQRTNLYSRLEKTLFRWPGTREKFKLSHALAGILIMGASRSGKTSGVLEFILKQWIMNFGGLFTVTRINDAEMYIKLAEECGRRDDVIYFHEGSNLELNLLEYELSRFSKGEVDLEHIVDNMLIIHSMISSYESGGGGSKNDDQFWQNSSKNLIIFSLSLLILSDRPVTWKAIRKLAQDALNEAELEKYYSLWSILQTQDQSSAQWQSAWTEYTQWRDHNTFIAIFDEVNERDDLTKDELETLQDIGDYFTIQFSKLAPKTKSIILEIIISICRPFETSKILKKHFASGFSPELHPARTYTENKIVICGFGVKEHGLSGLIANGICKLIFTQEWERRDIKTEGVNASPVALVMDEFQYYVGGSTKDNLYISTAGGSLVSNILVTQNLDNVTVALGGQNAEAKARSLCGNLSTKLFCANGNFTTNKWASDMIGSHYTDAKNSSISFETGSKKSFNQQFQRKVTPNHFVTLKTGRKENRYIVETVIVQNGKTWIDGENYGLVNFTQDY